MLFTPAMFLSVPFTALAFRTSATSTSASITVPATAQEGDLAIVCDYATNAPGTAPTGVTPSGYTQFTGLADASAVDGSRTRWYYKLLAYGDAGTSVTGMNGGNSNNKVMLVFSGYISWTTEGATPQAATSAGDPVAQTTTASADAVPQVVIGAGASYSALPAFTTNSLGLTAVTVGTLRVGYKVQSSAPSDATLDTGDNGTANYLGLGVISVA